MDISTDSDNKSCLLVSTLIKVTEQFLQSTKGLKKDIGSDANTRQQQLRSVMEHYDRLNIVMKVLKIAYPLQINTPNENNVVNTAMKNVTATVSNTLSKMNEIPIKPELRHHDVAVSRPGPRYSPPPPPPLPWKSKPKPKPKHTTPHTESTKQPPAAVAAAHTHASRSVEPPSGEVSRAPPVKNNSPQIKNPESSSSSRAKPKERTTKPNNISSSVFLDQFEKTAHEFATQHNIAMEQIWESLLVHALPKDKLAWAEKTILNKNMDWKTARGHYLSAYSDVVPSKKIIVKELDMPALVKTTSALAGSTQPSYVPTTTTDANAQTRERQSRYAEYLLSIEMKEYDSITEYNSKFYRYASIACMNLTDVSLFRRYVSSLLPKYRLPVERVIQQNSPQNLKETMNLACGVIIPLEKARKSNGEACWKHPLVIKRNGLEENTSSPKRFCA